jgi:hypothetical protein
MDITIGSELMEQMEPIVVKVAQSLTFRLRIAHWLAFLAAWVANIKIEHT